MIDKPIAPRSVWERMSDEQSDLLFKMFRWGIIVTFIIMVIAALLQVISRYFFNYPLGWTGELAQIMIDGQTVPLSLVDGRVELPITPGSHDVARLEVSS